MKTNITIWTVSITQFAMSDKDLYNEIRQHLNEEDALKDFKSTKQWLMDYATRPDNEDGSFEGRIFSAESKEHVLEASGDLVAIVKRYSEVNEEFFKGEVRMIKQMFEVDVPIILDVKDIKQIQIITND